MKENAPDAKRPTRGRPRKAPAVDPPVDPPLSSVPTTDTTSKSTDIDDDPPFHGFAATTIAALDFSKPPPGWRENSNQVPTNSTAAEATYITGPPPAPGFPHKPASWTASKQELDIINSSITRRIGS